ncbi:hypothetical protein ACFFK0_22540 [Paenibacillus chartarius]|uniref:Uncharacterized protein n=1 Tax=Paenibacillus chartarius TaxID=747481 RepID=A0ABV6DRB2_9BACL
MLLVYLNRNMDKNDNELLNEGVFLMGTCSNEIAKVTKEGVLFNGEYYSSPLALKENWFQVASVSGEWYLPAFLEESNKNVLMVRPVGREDYIQFHLLMTRAAAADREQYYKKIQELKEQISTVKKATRN